MNEEKNPTPNSKRTVVIADKLGFCYGVRRAVQIAEETRSNRIGRVTTLGPIIHNQQVVDRHKEMGIDFSATLEDIHDGAVIMSAHGVPPCTLDQAKEQGLEIIDATCPFVTKVHRAAKKMAEEGYQIIIVGDKGHTEVKGALGTVESAGGKAFVVSKPEEIADLSLNRKVGIISQTTQKPSTFAAVVSEVVKIAYETRIYNTICGATEELQSAAIQLADKVDAVIVIGGKNSANTKRLRDICEAEGVPAFHIETADEIKAEWLEGKNIIGVTAGASTPDWIINEVVQKLESV